MSAHIFACRYKTVLRTRADLYIFKISAGILCEIGQVCRCDKLLFEILKIGPHFKYIYKVYKSINSKWYFRVFRDIAVYGSDFRILSLMM